MWIQLYIYNMAEVMDHDFFADWPELDIDFITVVHMTCVPLNGLGTQH